MSLVSSIVGSHQISAASNTMQGTLNQAINSTNSMFGNAVGALYGGISGANDLLKPYMNMGNAGLTSLTSMLAPGGPLTQQFSFDPTQVANNPDYQFALQQGNQAVQRAAAANGTLMSGGTLKSLDQYSQGLASQYMNQYYSQALNTFNTNRTANLQNATLPISIGQSAASQGAGNIMQGNSQIANTTMSTAQMLNGLLEGKGNASAAGSIMQGNTWGNFLTGGGLGGPVSSLMSAVGIPGAAASAIGSVMGL